MIQQMEENTHTPSQGNDDSRRGKSDTCTRNCDGYRMEQLAENTDSPHKGEHVSVRAGTFYILTFKDTGTKVEPHFSFVMLDYFRTNQYEEP